MALLPGEGIWRKRASEDYLSREDVPLKEGKGKAQCKSRGAERPSSQSGGDNSVLRQEGGERKGRNHLYDQGPDQKPKE